MNYLCLLINVTQNYDSRVIRITVTQITNAFQHVQCYSTKKRTHHFNCMQNIKIKEKKHIGYEIGCKRSFVATNICLIHSVMKQTFNTRMNV